MIDLNQMVRVRRQTTTFDFDSPSEFSLRELVPHDVHLSQNVIGKVLVIAGKHDQHHKIQVHVSVEPRDISSTKAVQCRQTETALFINLCDLSMEGNSGSNVPHLKIYVTIAIAPMFELKSFDIHTTHLAIEIAAGVSVTVENQTVMSTVRANITCLEANTFTTRKTIIDVTNGSLMGTWALRDLLSIKSTSGSINIDVVPKAASEKDPQPADFIVSSVSGSVAVRYIALNEIPHRDYRVDVKVRSASVSGMYIHGTRTNIESTSGSITADIQPCMTPDCLSRLITHSSSGTTSLRVLSPRTGCIDPNHLESRHEATSGSLDIHYPQQWEGMIHGKATTGSLTLKGRDIQVIKDDRNGPTRSIWARKGNGYSNLNCYTTSGSINLVVGNR